MAGDDDAASETSAGDGEAGEGERSAGRTLHVVADVERFEGTDRILADVEGREVAVFDLDGEFFALANYCVHQGGPLCEGTVSGALTTNEDFELAYGREGEVVSCPWHGWEFDVRTGEHLAETGYRTPTYDVVVRDGKVYVEF